MFPDRMASTPSYSQRGKALKQGRLSASSSPPRSWKVPSGAYHTDKGSPMSKGVGLPHHSPGLPGGFTASLSKDCSLPYLPQFPVGPR